MSSISVDYDVLNQKGSPAWYSDTFANIPTPGYKGRMFISTDTFAFYRDNGTGWDLVGGPGTGTITGAGVSGQVTYFIGTDTIGGNNNLFYDITNSRLGIGTATPGAPLDIHTTGTAAQFNGTGVNNSFVLFQNAGSSKWRIGNLYNSGANDYQIFDVTNSTARLTIKNTGASTLIGTFTATSLIKSGGTNLQILLADGSTTPTSTFGAGSVTSVSALTLGTTGTDLTSSVVNSTTTPVITLNVPTASATNRGALSSADWTTFNNKQATLSLTTTGTSGAATLVGATLNIPNYTNVGTVTSVAALTLGTTGTDLSSSVANSTTTPVITLNVPTASATNRGALSSADWTTFNNKQGTISVTAPVVLTGATISMPAATTSVSGYLTSTDWNTFNSKTSNLGTVTDVVALTIGTTGIDITSTAVTTTTTPVITLNIPTASASNRGALSSTDWTTFNNKQATLSLTTTGTSGAATLVANTLNIPNYGSALSGYVPYTGATTSVNLGIYNLRATKLSLGTSSTTYPINIEDSTLTKTFIGLFNTIGTAGATAGLQLGISNGTLATGSAAVIETRGLTAADAALDFKVLYNYSLVTALTLGSNGAATFSNNLTLSNANSITDLGGVLKVRGNGSIYDTHYLTTGAANVAAYYQYNASGSAINLINAGGNSYITGGNVGIGTPAPSYKLDVSASSMIRGTLAIDNNGIDASPTEYIRFERNSQGSGSYINSIYSGTGSGSNTMQFRLSGTGGTQSTIISLLGTGNVGINTITPNYKLEVVGNGSFTGNSTTTGTIYIQSGNQWSLNADQSGGGSPQFAASGFYIKCENTSTIALGFNTGGAATFSSSVTTNSNLFVTNGSLNFGGTSTFASTDPAIYRVAGNDLAIAIGSTERLRITSVGILNSTTRANFLGATDNSLFSLNSGGTLYTVGFSPTATANSSNTLTLTTGQTTWIYTGSGTATWTLPNPSGTNQMFWIKNAGTGIITLNAYSGTNIINNAASSVSSITIAIGATALIQQDGNVKSYQLQ